MVATVDAAFESNEILETFSPHRGEKVAEGWMRCNASQSTLTGIFAFAGICFRRAAFRPLSARGKGFSGLKAALRTSGLP